MQPTHDKVIVFGPTGGVASNAVTRAHKLGCEVVLAMRDTSKKIPGLSEEEEKSGKYKRVTADLHKPDSVKAAVQESGAKVAFCYLVWGTSDHMLGTFQAMKDGGIELLVFLSSFTVPQKAKQMEKVEPDDMISYAHTQAELALAKVYDEKHYVALRPGYFATNVLQQKLGIVASSVSILAPDTLFDYITPEDMGEAAGSILARGPRDDQHIVYLFGPDMLSQREAYHKIGKALGKDMNVSEISSQEEAVANFMAAGAPESVAKLLAKHLSESKPGEGHVGKKQHEQGRANVEKYASRPGMRLDDWVTKNADMFATEISDVATAMPESAPEPEEPEEEPAEGEAKEGAEGEEGEGKEQDTKSSEKEETEKEQKSKS